MPSHGIKRTFIHFGVNLLTFLDAKFNGFTV